MPLNYGNAANYNLDKYTNTCLCYRRAFLFCNTASVHLPITLTRNRDSVKPKPQLCMNQNNNPQRFLLPPFPDTLCDSFAVESSTRENPLMLISSPDTPTCRGVTAGCPSSAFQGELMMMCVCVYVYHWSKISWKTKEVNEDGWASLNPQSSVIYVIYYVTNFLMGCVAL